MPLLTHGETDAGGVTVLERNGAAASASGRTAAGSARTAARRGRGIRRGRLSRKRLVKRILFGTAAAFVLGPILAFVVGWLMFPVPSPDQAAIAQVATFTFADGTPLATVRPDNVNRVKVTLDRVPEHVRHAVLAAEDRSFYTNPGFDILGIGRAVWNQLTGGVGGGSTITQQYVKVSTGHDEYSLWRKYKEIILAVKISRQLSKEQILENYLNVIYLGRGAYGIQAAAQAYFGKDVEQLTVSEAAMLAGAIQSPSRWDPAKNPEKSRERWAFVLDGMVSQKWLSPEERAQQVFPTNWLPEPPRSVGIPGDDRGHIYNLAKAELEERGITEDQLNTEGLTVTTTVDPNVQRMAVKAVQDVLKGQPNNLRSALVAVDPKTGAIVAYYGGSNGVGLDYAQALRQPGSSFKPFVFAAALESNRGIGLGSIYDGSSPQEFPGGVTVRNSEGYDCDRCTVQTAMTRSINTVFYRMALEVGPDRVVEVAHRAGIPEDLLKEARGGIALGDQEVRPVDMASAFATFAADGVRRERHIVSKVTTADGRVLYDRASTSGEQVFSQQVARNVTESMRYVADSSGIALRDGRPVAAKTGTVQHPTERGQNKDAWTVGYTPSLVTAVWVGSDTSEPIKNSAGRPIFGRMLPGQMWQKFMSDALRNKPREEFSRFTPIGPPPVSESDNDTGSSTNTPSPSTSASPDYDNGNSSDEWSDSRGNNGGSRGSGGSGSGSNAGGGNDSSPGNRFPFPGTGRSSGGGSSGGGSSDGSDSGGNGSGRGGSSGGGSGSGGSDSGSGDE